MMQELYTYLEDWLHKDKIATQGLDWLTLSPIKNIHQTQVTHRLKRMREVYFKKDWTINHPSIGPLSVYIV